MSDAEDRPGDAQEAVPVAPPLPSATPLSGAPAVPSLPAATPWTVPSDESASTGEHGWPMVADDSPGNGGELDGQPPVSGEVPPPRRASDWRHPVDRLTRRLPTAVRVTVDWVFTIVGAVVIVLVVKAFVVNPYRIPSSSMESTLHCSQPAVGCETRSAGPIDLSDRVLANRFLYRIRDPRRGEIIVFRTPPEAQIRCGAGGTFVKRLVGLPGDTVEVRLRDGDGYVYINGKPLREPYIEKSRRSAIETYPSTKIKPGNYFMMGDNRAQSCDSRLWGTVPRANLIGKVFATYWPPNRISLH